MFIPSAQVSPPPPPRGASFCLPPNVTGVSASVNNKFYKLYGAATFEAAGNDCATRGGQLPKWESHAEQYAVEQILFGNSSNVIMYWLGARAIMTDTRVFRYTTASTSYNFRRAYQSGDKWDYSSLTRAPYPLDTSPYSHWGENEPSTWGIWATADYTTSCNAQNFDIDNRCILAVESLKYATVGGNYSRVVNDSYGNAWGWARADCFSNAFYICNEQSELCPGHWAHACRQPEQALWSVVPLLLHDISARWPWAAQ